MGDISAEPSMEEILSSIKRIIAEEGEGPRAPARRPTRPPVSIAPPEPDEVLELSEPMPARTPEPRAAEPPQAPAPRATEPARPEPAAAPRAADPAPAPVEPIVSHAAAVASRGALDTLSRLIVKPEGTQPETTLEGLVRDMLRPMLSEWLDARLPEIVEAMVAREIERITGSR